jgi:hypothetical protein
MFKTLKYFKYPISGLIESRPNRGRSRPHSLGPMLDSAIDIHVSWYPVLEFNVLLILFCNWPDQLPHQWHVVQELALLIQLFKKTSSGHHPKIR